MFCFALFASDSCLQVFEWFLRLDLNSLVSFATPPLCFFASPYARLLLHRSCLTLPSAFARVAHTLHVTSTAMPPPALELGQWVTS